MERRQIKRGNMHTHVEEERGERKPANGEVTTREEEMKRDPRLSSPGNV